MRIGLIYVRLRPVCYLDIRRLATYPTGNNIDFGENIFIHFVFSRLIRLVFTHIWAIPKNYEILFLRHARQVLWLLIHETILPIKRIDSFHSEDCQVMMDIAHAQVVWNKF